MSKLIGTNPNQVPSNADLGTAAFMDKKEFLLSKGSSLSAINAVIPKTAVDIFIYDTSKDSDGGAWRKRVQHTSWYNERLNTTTRGSRKEFPCVAVIVAEATEVTIYDADDINMPMWMTFPVNNSSWLKHSGSGGCKAVVARDGIMVTGGDLRGAIVRFIADDGNTFEAGYNYEHRTITTRNTSVGPSTGPIRIANNAVNDVAITVLPNAPIDADTGLPVPTIAVATDGGVSVIKDDGSVVDIVSSTAAGGGYDPEHVAFDKDNRLTLVQAYDAVAPYLNIFENIPSADVAQALSYSGATSYSYLDTGLNISGGSANIADLAHAKDEVALGFNTRLSILDSIPGAPTKSMVAYITSDYNTGWMHSDIKLATLSDTDATNISASGNTNILSGGWTNNGSFPYETFTTSGLDITSAINTTAYGAANKTWTATAGKTYTAYFNLTLNSGTAPTLFVQTSSSYGNGVSYQTVNGVNSFTFTATMSTSSYFSFSVNTGVATNFSVANLELYEGGVADRSVNGTSGGLSVFGTVTKTPVATGADLVAYSGFSTSNYLQQPYNSSLGLSSTDDLTIMCWVKQASHNGTIQIIFASGVMSGGQGRYLYTNSGIPRLDTYGGATNNSTRDITDNTWHHLTAIYTPNGIGYMYIDGILDSTTSLTAGYINQSANSNITIGLERNNTLPTNASISLLRVSNSVPTPEQIAKIYNDEKHLFQENAKATLYGSSDAVTALAYDDDTELLHVGTSAGRSEFQGLNRVNNTTDAVGAAISASNGFIVED